jgi:hypothetical protein
LRRMTQLQSFLRRQTSKRTAAASTTPGRSSASPTSVPSPAFSSSTPTCYWSTGRTGASCTPPHRTGGAWRSWPRGSASRARPSWL